LENVSPKELKVLMKSDIEIAQSAKPVDIYSVAGKAGIPKEYIEPYGKGKAKIDLSIMKSFIGKPKGKLILVTAITPTPAGEGKTTTTIGLADALSLTGRKTIVAIREPSLGPVFGIKGGAAGGGYSQVIPMEDINLHFTGDIHAIGAANNLLAAMIDNHIYQGNSLRIDPRRITWRRCMDMNDRQLRNIISGLGGATNGMPREDGFDITVASEVMAVLCLSESISDLKSRLSRIVIGYTYDGTPVTAGDLHAEGAMAALLRDAIKPNLVSTLGGTPALIHGGPFANIAHGCNSVIATKLALHFADYTVTEAGFGADLGAEKFFDIKCRAASLTPSAAVVVATVRALKMHGGAPKTSLSDENLSALSAGIPNLLRHVSNIRDVFGVPVVVAINRFPTDTQAELSLLRSTCAEAGVDAVISEVWEKGGEGGIELAERVAELCETKSNFRFAYSIDLSIAEKLNTIVKRIYRGVGVEFTPAAKKQLDKIEADGFGKLPVCVAKTQYSFSDDAQKLGAPEGFTVTVKNLRVSAGAGFIVALTGDIMTMPGLPKSPAAEYIDIDANGTISGLF